MVEKVNFSQEVEKSRRSIINRQVVNSYKTVLCELDLPADSVNMSYIKAGIDSKLSPKEALISAAWNVAKSNKISCLHYVANAIDKAMAEVRLDNFKKEHHVISNVIFGMRLMSIVAAIGFSTPIFVIIPSVIASYVFEFRGFQARPNMLTAKLTMVTYAVILVSIVISRLIQ